MGNFLQWLVVLAVLFSAPTLLFTFILRSHWLAWTGGVACSLVLSILLIYLMASEGHGPHLQGVVFLALMSFAVPTLSVIAVRRLRFLRQSRIVG
jgi:hypothetical protein